MKIPNIGITSTSVFDGLKHFETYRYTKLSYCFIEAVCAEGGLPLVLPIYPETADEHLLYEQVKRLDGIILSGGEDVNPRLWGDEPSKGLHDMHHARDAFEFKLIKLAHELQKPILAICRGAQILNVYFGGTLYQDIFTEANANIAHVQKAQFNEATHKVRISPTSITRSIFAEEMWVNSYHHMAVKKLAEAFICTASSSDGIIEMFERQNMDTNFMLGVQWHPEMMYKTSPEMKALFHLFVTVCAQ